MRSVRYITAFSARSVTAYYFNRFKRKLSFQKGTDHTIGSTRIDNRKRMCSPVFNKVRLQGILVRSPEVICRM